jgi:hypothetical protein
MKNFDFKKIIPHVAAIIIFLLVSYIYCRPAFEGQVLQQSDALHWKGTARDGEIYAEKHNGERAMWNKTLFGGMPTTQIAPRANNSLPWLFSEYVFSLHLPLPAAFFFVACVMFYILAIVLGVNPWLGIMGAIAFAYNTYDPVIIVAGHNTKMWSIAYMPAVLASMILIFKKKYWLGTGLMALFLSIMVAMNHVQIVYYTFIVIGVMSVFYLIKWIREKEFAHIGKTIFFALAGIVIGIAVNAVLLLQTYEYQKDSIRGTSPLQMDPTKKAETNQGLTKEYAFDYSMGLSEPFALIVPGIYGRSNIRPEVSEDNSKAIEEVRNMPQEAQQFFQQNGFIRGTEEGDVFAATYWGDSSTSGPPYASAVICFLAILGMFILEGKHKWWMFTAIVLAILMAWGSNFAAFNNILFDHLPFYNKFRAPVMTMVIAQLLLPVMAMLCVDKIIKTKDKETLYPMIKKGLIATAAIFVFLFALYLTFDYKGEGDRNVLKQIRESNQQQLIDLVNTYYSGLIADRKAILLGDIFRSLGFIIAALAVVFLLIKRTIKPVVAIAGLILLVMIDLFTIDIKYLSPSKYKDNVENNQIFEPTSVDKQILQDTSDYRVFNLTDPNGPFNDAITSYHHRSVGGYHPAKLRIYQDLIENQLSKNNQAVLDMLNTKYVIQPGPNKQPIAITRGTQLGSAWLVKSIRFVDGYVNVMKALDHFNPKDTAIVEKSMEKEAGPQPVYDSTAKIELVINDNDVVKYKSSSKSNQFAVFSEIYYKDGWKAFVDGKETPIVRVNYVLRGLALPAGNHNIEFRFAPESYTKGSAITRYAQYLLVLILLVGLFMAWRTRKKTAAVA